MHVIGNKARKAGVSRSNKDKKTDSRAVRITLTQVEREILLKACQKYRYAIPAYIRSRQAEIDSLDAILGKLA